MRSTLLVFTAILGAQCYYQSKALSRNKFSSSNTADARLTLSHDESTSEHQAKHHFPEQLKLRQKQNRFAAFSPNIRSYSMPSVPSSPFRSSQSLISTSTQPAPLTPERLPKNLSRALITLDGPARPSVLPRPAGEKDPPEVPTVDISTSEKDWISPPMALERPGCRRALFLTSLFHTGMRKYRQRECHRSEAERQPS